MSATAISVAVRVRPFNSREIKYKSTLVVNMPDENNLEMLDPRRSSTNPVPPRKFQFDHCMWTHNPSDPNFVDQKKVYDSIGKPVLDNAMQGFNACLFAFGQTGSGKSYTVMGSKEDPGVIPRLCLDLFERIAEKASTHSVYVETQYIEIYNELTKDLLNPANINKALKVRQHPQLGVFIEGVKKIACRSAEDITKLIDDGTQVRSVASTAMNATSSRSHAILSLNVRVKSAETETMSTIHLVDLAGSERADSTGAEGATLKEGANINKSLSVLGMCLSRLAEIAEGKKGGHIPYRDSQLTWLLHESLGGNSKTAMLAAISPADINYEETLSTLRFASITKKIKMVVKINEDPQTKIIRELREQIAQIKEEIMALAEGRVYTRAPVVEEEEEKTPTEAPTSTTTTTTPPEDIDAGGAAGESLPEEVSVDVRQQQLCEELEENFKLIQEFSMTDEQRRIKEEKERADHERQMTELKKGSKGIASNDEENCPKFLLLNEDLHNLRLADGKPLQIVHSLIKPEKTNLEDDDEEGDEKEKNKNTNNNAVAVQDDDDDMHLLDGNKKNNSNNSDRRRRSGSSRNNTGDTTRFRSRSVVNNPKFSHTYTICGQAVTSTVNPDEDDADSAIVPWLKLPAASGLTNLMRLEVVVDFHAHKMFLNFEDYSHYNNNNSNTSTNNNNETKEIVFVNGKPLRTLSEGINNNNNGSFVLSPSPSASGNSRDIFAQIHHNDRVIIGSVIFRVFEPISWRVDALGGQDETFLEEDHSVNTEHIELLENYHRQTIENECFESYFISVFGEEELVTMPEGFASPVPMTHSNFVAHHQNQNQNNNNINVNESSFNLGNSASTTVLNNLNLSSRNFFSRDAIEEVKADINTFVSDSRGKKVQAEKRLIEDFPRDLRRELRSKDVKDSIKFDGKFALQERQVYVREKQKEQEELQRKLEEGSAEIEKLRESLEQKQREREESDRKAKQDLEDERSAAIAKAKQEAELKKKEGMGTNAQGMMPTQVAAVKSSAQGKLQLARRVHEYEELRRELMAWKPIGPTDPHDKPTYQLLLDNMSKSKPTLTYLEVRKLFDGDSSSCSSGNPLFEATIFKNRIKTGFFSRGGLHPVTVLIIDHFLFYFEAGAGLVSPAASQTKLLGFCFILGCEYGPVTSSGETGGTIDGKPALRVVSCAPRKTNQVKNDAHHAVEFGFANVEQKNEFASALDRARLPAADADVAAALATLDKK